MEAWQTLEHLLVRCGLAFVLLSVWTWRLKRPTKFRGKDARSLEEEFKVYGLSKKTMHVIGTLKILISLCFLCGHWVPFLIRPAAVILAAIMFMAVLYHFKVENKNYFKALPAYLVLLFAIYLVIM